MDEQMIARLRDWADKYEDMQYFREDPIIFPEHFCEGGFRTEDVEIAGIISAHLAWGRRPMIVRDCGRAMDEMDWKPYDYVMSGEWRRRSEDSTSLHRTIRWSEFSDICRRLQEFYSDGRTLEELSADEIRTRIYGRASDPGAANKKIHMMRRWFVRKDSPVDLGIWKNTSPSSLFIPLDVHTYRQASELGIVTRKSKDMKTVTEITRAMEEVFPGDPCRGDFALFGYGVSSAGSNEY